jgi:hypothetical protein
MQRYRVFFLDTHGEPLNHEEVECRNDDEAIDRVGRSDHPYGIELREGARVVARFGAVGVRRLWRLGR